MHARMLAQPNRITICDGNELESKCTLEVVPLLVCPEHLVLKVDDLKIVR
jgi:hypothetical protein